MRNSENIGDNYALNSHGYEIGSIGDHGMDSVYNERDGTNGAGTVKAPALTLSLIVAQKTIMTS